MPIALAAVPRLSWRYFLALLVATATWFTVDGSLMIPALLIAVLLLACSARPGAQPLGRMWLACLVAGAIALGGQALGAGVHLGFGLPWFGGRLALWIA